MSVNFYKHRDQMVSAYKEVIDEKSPIDWALFGYEKQTNDLMLVGKGDGGLEELSEELNSSKILYAFCKVKDPNTELVKYILINWQGEGAPLQRKGVCINHFRDVSDFFKGSHLTINARTEEEVEPATILSQISKVSAKVNLKDRSDLSENVSPVGTNYKRVQPQREISQTDREKFWIQTQEEEKKRLTEEKKKAIETKTRLEKEREERELKEAKQREAIGKERDKQILKLREAQQNAENAAKNDLKDKTASNDSNDDNERRKRSEMMRRERAEEAKSIIPQQSIRSARAIFEQNTSAGQLNSIRSSSQTENKLISSRKEIFESNKVHEKEKVVETKTVPNNAFNSNLNTSFEPSVDEKDVAAANNTSFNGNEVEAQSPVHMINENQTQNEVEKEPPDVVYTRNLLEETYLDNHPLEDIVEEQTWDDGNRREIQEEEDQYDSTENFMENREQARPEESLKKARALFDYQAADDTEISFDPDDIITMIDQIDSGWWQGLAPDGKYGLFPANYVELID